MLPIVMFDSPTMLHIAFFEKLVSTSLMRAEGRKEESKEKRKYIYIYIYIGTIAL